MLARFNNYSLVSLLVILITYLWVSFNMHIWRGEYILVHDVLGYWLYLPGIFLYGDIQNFAFMEEIANHYWAMNPNNLYQLVEMQTGEVINRYTIGMSILYLPAFAIGHLFAQFSILPADGFFLFPLRGALGQ